MAVLTPRSRWWVVLASGSGLIVGQGPILVFATGVFLRPVSEDLGFGRGEISTAIGISNVMTAISAPLFGRAIDLWGVRRPLLTSIALFALATAAMAMLAPSFVVLAALYAVAGFVSAGQSPAAYSKVIA